ncbi:response regulator [Oxalobacteraceae bacterium R-40]|uniref:Response regulator n=1 Tax=Keguizhuia sedimenti TaxID=3064264 RepID=A0ABU1BLZ9_9BURK|nr:response regulator [Oxalobacteraceae bacterium R-40]
MQNKDSLPRILIVDDDFDIRSLLADYLESNGFHALTAPDGMSMARVLAEQKIDLVVLDWNMPGEDGLSLCRKLRANSNLPIIMLTARGEPVDRIIGLETGADDYVSKPFEPRELLARIRSLLRRSHAPVAGSASALRQQLQFANWTLDCDAGHLIAADGMIVMLSSAELRLLKVFLDNPKRVLSRDQLLNHTQGSDAGALDRAIDIQVSRLRQKLNEDARSPQIIKTVRNGGYMLDVAVNPGVSSA